MTAQTDLKGGRVIAGKFRLEWPIGRGGMGTVWAAMHLQLDMPVAVKFMDPSAADADGRARFEREARAIAQLRSPHVVQVLDHGVDGQNPYIVMELLEGEDLESRLRRVKKLPLAVATRIFTQSAKALRRAHDAGIVHRDLKPNNVFLARVDDEEVVKLLDFGVAKMTWTGALDPHNESTQQGLLLGSPCYMSPEQARGNKNVDHRSDLWALAVILFRSITGVRPFDAATVADLIIKICAEPPPVASHISPDLPAGTDDFFFRAFSHDPDQRYQSALEMASDFEALVKNFSATETFTGGRIVTAATQIPQRTATNPQLQMPPALQRTASSPGFASPALTRTATNPAMRAISMSGQLVPADPARRATQPSVASFDPTPAQPSVADRFPPPAMPQAPAAAPAFAPSPRLSYPGDPPMGPAGFGSGIYPGPAQRPGAPPPPVGHQPAPAPYAQSYGGAQPGMSAPADPNAYGADAGGYDPSLVGLAGQGEPDDPYAAEQTSSDPEAAPLMDQPTPSAPAPVPDSAQAIGSTSSTVRERSPSGRQLVVWTTVAALITAILVVAIFIVARARASGDNHGTSAKPQGSGDVGLTQPAPQPQPTETTHDATQPAPPATDATTAPTDDLVIEPVQPGHPSGLQGAPSASASASASAAIQAVPFALEEDAGAPSPPPSTSAGPKPQWNPSGKKTKPNFGY